MRVRGVRKIAPVGFSQSDRDLLARQLKTVSARLPDAWEIAEAGHLNVDVAICREPLEAPAGIPVSVTTGPIREGFDHALEFPIRLFALLDILNQATGLSFTSDRGASPFQAGLQAEQILALSGAFRCGETSLIFEGERVYSNQPDVREICRGLTHDPLQRVDRNALGDLINRHDRRALLWAVACAEPALELRGWNPSGTRVRLCEWPSFGIWLTEPWMIRASAPMVRGSASLGEAARIAEVEPSRVAALIHACIVCGLKVDVLVGESESAQVTLTESTSSAREQNSFFRSLRRRLGLSKQVGA